MKVSVLMPTYNHSATIAQAIDSFLAQKCCFDIQLLISDDASTDATLSIARKYESENHDKIVVITKPENEGLIANYRTLVSRAEGEYLAVLESDDYWSDPLKLQKQIDFLDANADYGLSFTRVMFLQEGVLREDYDYSELLESLQGELYSYMLLRSIIYSPTVVFRRNLFEKYCNIDEYVAGKFITFDYPVWLSIAAHSKCNFLNDITAVYRISSSSISNTSNLRKRLEFEKGVSAIRSYITGLYGTGNIGSIRIWMRDVVLQLRIIWRYIIRH
ncbi:MAG: glycosyltransferase [Paludibacteraceae bacterium]|nr:glycosyltransferase [Paludibacteraceae bacterium]